MTTWLLSENVLGLDLIARPLALRVESGVLTELRPLKGADGLPTQDEGEVFDFGTAPIVPGWVNGHVHLAMAPLRGITTRTARAGNVVQDVFFRIEKALSRQDVFAFTRHAALESLLHGVTEVWDHYYFANSVTEALEEVGLGGTVAPTLQDVSGPGASQWQEALRTTQDIANDSRLAALGIHAALGVHATDTVSPHLLAQVGELAVGLHLPVHLHLLQHAEEVMASSATYPQGIITEVLSLLRAGTGPGRSRLLVAHALHVTRRDIDQLVQAGARLAFCPLSQGQFGLHSPIAAWRQAGGEFVLGTDSVASNDSLDLQRELSLLAGLPGLGASFRSERDAVLSAADDVDRLQATARLELERQRLATLPFPLEPATLLAAAWGLHLPGGPRGIQVGAPANLLILDPQHPALFPAEGLARALCCGSLAGAIHQVFSRGRPVFPEAGQPSSLVRSPRYLESLAEATARKDELFARTLGASRS